MHPLLLDEPAAARIDELLRQAGRERLALSLDCPTRVATPSRRSLRALGFLLVGAGPRLAMAGDRRGHAGRSAA